MTDSKPVNIERVCRQLMRKHRLRSIDIVIANDNVFARAMPDRHSQLVQQRYEAALGKLNTEYVSLSDATRLGIEAAELQVAVGTGKTIAEAIGELGGKLGTK